MMKVMQSARSSAASAKRGISHWGGIVFVIAAIAVSSWYYFRIGSDAPLLLQNLGLSGLTASSTQSSTTSAPTPKEKRAPASNVVRKSSTVVAIARNLPNTSQFNALFKSTGVAASITGAGPYTIFVPTNGAVSQLPPGTITKMSDAQKLRFIQYHIISGRAIDSEAQVAGTIQALSGDALNFSFGVDKIPLVNSAIFIHKYQASNGVVYLIDNVLLPPQRF